MANEGSVAPKERVNIKYRPATGDAKEEKELPLKLLLMGDYTLRNDETPLEERKPVQVSKDNFNDVMRKMDLNLKINVANTLSEGEGEEMAASLKFDTLKDFGPEAIAEQVPELNQMMELRKALVALKGPMGNLQGFRKKIQGILGDESSREKLLAELGGAAAPSQAASEPAGSDDGGGDDTPPSDTEGES